MDPPEELVLALSGLIVQDTDDDTSNGTRGANN